MNKWIKIGFPFLCVVVVLFTFYLLHNAEKKIEEKETNENSTKVENVVNEIEEENEVEVENVVNTTEPEEIKTVVQESGASASSLYEKNNEAGSTQKKNEAIQLVKENWGADDTVSFRCDQVTGDGIYVIAVVNKQTGNVQNYFRVNLEDKIVQVDY